MKKRVAEKIVKGLWNNPGLKVYDSGKIIKALRTCVRHNSKHLKKWNELLKIENPPKSIDELGDDLCDYCPLEKKGVYGSPGGDIGCEGVACESAYISYLECWEEEYETTN